MRDISKAGVVAVFALLVTAGGARAFDDTSLVRQKCAGCHRPAADGRLAQVEDLRTTPEEWTVIVDRMRRLYGLSIGPGEMDRLLKELSATQSLTPDEQAQVAYLSLWHNSQHVEKPSGKEEEKVFTTCVRCHTAGKIWSYRRTPESWAKLRDFHLYVVPTVVFQMREMHWVPEADAVLAWLAQKLPYGKAWSSPETKLAGTWGVFGYEPGKGTYRGEARISDTGNSEYQMTGSVAYSDGTRETFAGEGTLYGGFALRTRTTNNGFAGSGAYILRGDQLTGETHLPAPEFHTSRALWLADDGTPKIARIVPSFLIRGEKTTLTVEGLNLPDAKVGQISFGGAPVRVLAAERVTPGAIVFTVVSGADKLGDARVSVKGIDAGTVKLAPRIDGIAITPEMGRARVSGGVHYPAEGVQFEAIAYANQGGGKRALRVPLGPVPAAFRLAEEKTRPGDDDLRWLGAIKPNGSYVPGDYGANPSRNYSAENTGLVKVLASYKRGTRTLTAEAALLVTVPDFIARIR
jgi:quinohemoprotein amine dehydrogenase alpha subunit